MMFLFVFVVKNVPIKVADNNQVWNGYFDSLLKLYVSAIINETGQIYQHEQYISNSQEDIMKLVGKKTILMKKYFVIFMFEDS